MAPWVASVDYSRSTVIQYKPWMMDGRGFASSQILYGAQFTDRWGLAVDAALLRLHPDIIPCRPSLSKPRCAFNNFGVGDGDFLALTDTFPTPYIFLELLLPATSSSLVAKPRPAASKPITKRISRGSIPSTPASILRPQFRPRVPRLAIWNAQRHKAPLGH